MSEVATDWMSKFLIKLKSFQIFIWLGEILQNYGKRAIMKNSSLFWFNLFLGTSFSLILSLEANSNEIYRPLTVSELAKHPERTVKVEKGKFIKNAEVAWANYQLIRHDFPAIAHFSNEQIDQWLITNFAYIGYAQKVLENIQNTPIEVEDKEKYIYRPVFWHSAGILYADAPDGSQIGLVDVNGLGHGSQSRHQVGAQVRQAADKSPKVVRETFDSGLITLGEAIAEVTRQTAIQMLFELEDNPHETVESYAIITAPFSILRNEGGPERAALYLRQAHRPRYTLHDVLEVPDSIYTDSVRKRDKSYYGAAVNFEYTLIQDERLLPNFGGSEQPEFSNPWIWGHETAWAYTLGDKNAISEHLEMMIAPIKGIHQNSPIVKERHRVREHLKRKIQEHRKAGMKLEDIHEQLKCWPALL